MSSSHTQSKAAEQQSVLYDSRQYEQRQCGKTVPSFGTFGSLDFRSFLTGLGTMRQEWNDDRFIIISEFKLNSIVAEPSRQSNQY